MSSEETFEQWAIVDVMGHQRYIGLVSEQVIAGTGFVRVDVPETDHHPAWTKLLGTSSIYAITPVEKDIAVAMANKRRDTPVQPYEMKPRLMQSVLELESEQDEDDDF